MIDVIDIVKYNCISSFFGLEFYSLVHLQSIVCSMLC